MSANTIADNIRRISVVSLIDQSRPALSEIEDVRGMFPADQRDTVEGILSPLATVYAGEEWVGTWLGTPGTRWVDTETALTALGDLATVPAKVVHPY